MIKKFESQFNGTKEMSEKHFIDPEILAPFLEKNVTDFSGPLEIKEFIGGQSNPTYFLKAGEKLYVLRRPSRCSPENCSCCR